MGNCEKEKAQQLLRKYLCDKPKCQVHKAGIFLTKRDTWPHWLCFML